jgi:hypothetical protein
MDTLNEAKGSIKGAKNFDWWSGHQFVKKGTGPRSESAINKKKKQEKYERIYWCWKHCFCLDFLLVLLSSSKQIL